MLEVLNCKMFEVLKNQFRSNLQQDLLALSGFCTLDELEGIVSECVEICEKKSKDVKVESSDPA